MVDDLNEWQRMPSPGTIIFALLEAVSSRKLEETHGAELHQEIEKQFRGRRSIPLDNSTVYTSLRRLKDLGLVKPVDEVRYTVGRPRRFYILTKKGREYLDWINTRRQVLTEEIA